MCDRDTEIKHTCVNVREMSREKTENSSESFSLNYVDIWNMLCIQITRKLELNSHLGQKVNSPKIF